MLKSPRQVRQTRSVEQTLFDAVGGEEFFVKLVDGFYVGVESDEVLRPMYVDQDLAEARRHLTLFLQQYWGGPSIYQAERGHPRLRMRHMPFAIDLAARNGWVACMRGALQDAGIEQPHRDAMMAYFERTATFLMNRE